MVVSWNFCFLCCIDILIGKHSCTLPSHVIVASCWHVVIYIGENLYFDSNYKLAATCDFQQCGILTSVDSEEPVQPPLSLETIN